MRQPSGRMMCVGCRIAVIFIGSEELLASAQTVFHFSSWFFGVKNGGVDNRDFF